MLKIHYSTVCRHLDDAPKFEPSAAPPTGTDNPEPKVERAGLPATPPTSNRPPAKSNKPPWYADDVERMVIIFELLREGDNQRVRIGVVALANAIIDQAFERKKQEDGLS